jgi:hypothetical protein
LKLIKIQTDNSDCKVVVFDHSGNPVGEFYASKNLDPSTNREYPFNITFESPKYDEVMSTVLLKQEIINEWLAQEKVINPRPI